jgi:hypothetical protein
MAALRKILELVLFAAVGVWGTAALTQSDSATPDPKSNPDPRVRAYYQKYEGEIARLRSIAENGDSPVAERTRAFQELILSFKDVAFLSAAKLVKDRSTPIARQAVEVLSSAIGMGSHADATKDHQEQASMASDYVGKQENVARQALREAIKDPRPEVGSPARQALLPLSDEAAIASVKEAVKSGALPGPEGVRLCAQAASDRGRGCVLDFLSEGSPETKAAAVNVLGSIPHYRPLVRDKIYLASAADPKLRAAAANVLAHYDPAFLTYGLTVAVDPKVPAEVYAAAVNGYAISARAQGKYDSAQGAVVMRALGNKLELLQEGSPEAAALATTRQKLENQ